MAMKQRVKKSNVKVPVKKKADGIELKAVKLKEMVSRAVKGASNNKLVPLTSMLNIELKDKKLTLTTTDATNYLYIIEDKIDGDDFYVTVPVEVFSKLISHMTCETVKLNLKGNALEVVGNGTYKIELPMDENGDIIKFPDPRQEAELETLGDIQLTSILTILNTAKASIATTLEIPCYTGYYCGERVITTDTYKICGIDLNLFGDNAYLISPELMNLLSVMTFEDIGVDANEDTFIFSSPDCVIYGRTMEGIEEFQVEDIDNVLDTEFPAMCKIKKSSILSLLDRISLFVTSFDKNEIGLTFTKEGLQVASKALSGVEVVKYVESENFQDFECSVDIKMLQSQIQALAGDVVEIWYGENDMMSIVEGNITEVICFLDGEEVEDEEEVDDEDMDVEDDEE